MNHRPFVRMLLVSAATAAAVALAGCTAETLTRSSLRAKQPISPKMLAEIKQKNMTKDSPILVRLFKQESELEIWKKDRSGRYALLKTYPICRWSGELGPKIREGDRQAPEGFYTIAPRQMNPNSSYYLAFNMGYPNAFDRALGRTGSELMVHGDCSSRGCYAMTDEQIGEIYALARESFFGGQDAFQMQAYPFRMTPRNIAKHRTNPNMAFWRMLKQGYDHFEVTHLEPKVDVCEKRYVFNAEPLAGATSLPAFSPTGKCPEYQVPADIVAAVAEKQHRDAVRTVELVNSGMPAAPIKTGTDGGMNPVFLAALQAREGGTGTVPVLAPTSVPGTIPEHVNPPSAPRPVYASAQQAATAQTYALAEASTAETDVPAASSGSGVFDRLTSLIGFSESTTDQTNLVGTPRPAKPRTVAAQRPVRATPQQQPTQRAAAPVPSRPIAKKPTAVAAASRQTQPKPPLRGTDSVPLLRASAPAEPKPAARRPHPTTTAMAAPKNTIVGSQPMVPAGSFESRWSAFR